MAEYRISEAAQLLGVTPKALRHWDEIGLLVPTWRTWSDYRLYTEDDLARGAAVVLYRAAGVKLADIAVLIDDSSPRRLAAALRSHRADLLRRQAGLQAQLDAVTELIDNAEQGVNIMDDMTKYLGENMPAYQEEAQQRWGDTEEWATSQARAAEMTADDWERVKREQEQFAADLAQARADGVAPGSDRAHVLVERHRAMIAQWYEAPRARQWVLARMYTQDQRFSAAYGGNEDYLEQLVAAQARAEGIDEPSWD